MFEDKTIILAVHEYADFSATIKKGLKDLGFNVIELDTRQPPFRYKTIMERLYNFIRKSFFHDRNYKLRLKQKAIEKKLLQQLSPYTNIDYALLIRADILPEAVITTIREKTEMVAAYQWDGLERFPNIYDYIPKFDRFFVFDSKDLAIDKTLPTTNFYFNHIPVPNRESTEKQAFFMGSYFEHRNPILKDISQRLSDLGIKTDISIFSKHKHEIEKIHAMGFNHLDITISYEENLSKALSSDILIDVHINAHKGLSFRIFEALGYNKKIITTNRIVKLYDFYDENNIFVWEDDDINNLEHFLNAPYRQVSKEVKDRYSFDNWTHYILDQGKYYPISLPEQQ